MDNTVDLTRAKKIVADVAANRKRWGKHAGLGTEHSAEDVLNALVDLFDSGVLEVEGDYDTARADLAMANRQKGAAEARAKKYKHQLDDAHKSIKELTIALEDENSARSQWADKFHEAETARQVFESKLRMYEGQSDE